MRQHSHVCEALLGSDRTRFGDTDVAEVFGRGAEEIGLTAASTLARRSTKHARKECPIVAACSPRLLAHTSKSELKILNNQQRRLY